MKYLFKITETIEYEFVLDVSQKRYGDMDNLAWDDLENDSPLMNLLTDKMNGDFATGNNVTIDEVTRKDFIRRLQKK
tara:strand:+ start:212 stop:442 length:231 start_codon:yes stop_codon:yes gene_type:complete